MTAPDYTELREDWLRNLRLETSGASLCEIEAIAIGGAVLKLSDLLALLEHDDTAIAELQAQVEAKDAENAVMGGALTRISVGQPMTMMDGTTLMVCLPGTASQEIANAALAKVKRAALGQGEG